MSNARILANTINSSSQIVVPSGGVNFGTSTDGSGTVTGGILDDYEEGTFTPSLQNIDEPNYRSRTGKYTKIGRLVFIQVFFDIVSLNNSDLSAFSFALPFTTSSIEEAALVNYSIGYNQPNLIPSGASEFLNAGGKTQNGVFSTRPPYISDGNTASKYDALNSSGEVLISFLYTATD